MIHKRDNRGFSLVELIIVIAIMAILIGVLAPAYLRYVEKARKSSDSDAIATCLNAMETVILLPEYSAKIHTQTVFNVLIKNGILYYTVSDHLTGNRYSDMENEINAIMGKYELKSRDWKTYAASHLTPNMAAYLLIVGNILPDGSIQFTLYDFAGTDPKLSEYSSALKGKIDVIYKLPKW